MNTTCQQYMIALAETGSITQAAKRLNISQPALSGWITALESQLGIQLVIRSKKRLIFTPAGQIYLKGCYKMMQIKQQTYNQINGLLGSENETLVISGTPNGGAKIFSAVFSSFRDKYPSVKLTYLEAAPKNKYWKFQLPSSDMFAAALFHQGLSCQKSYPHSLDARGPRSKIVDI